MSCYLKPGHQADYYSAEIHASICGTGVLLGEWVQMTSIASNLQSTIETCLRELRKLQDDLLQSQELNSSECERITAATSNSIAALEHCNFELNDVISCHRFSVHAMLLHPVY